MTSKKSFALAIALLLASTLPNGLSAKARPNADSKPHEHGTASYYGDRFHGKPTASGEIFDKNALTAAHLRLPFGTRVKVTNLKNKKTAVVTINDRGPFAASRVIDVSKRVAKELGFVRHGVTKVRLEVLSDKHR
ncbi:MAG: septal ring lytic transglycosylase RlpA family protein [Thiotrichales bacterium]